MRLIRRQARWALGAAALSLSSLMLPAAGAAPAGLRFRAPVDLPAGTGSSEPTMAIDSRGRIYVSAIFGVPNTPDNPGTPVWRSVDGGRSFVKRWMTSAGPASTPLGGGDSALVVDKRDYLYATELWLGNDSVSISTDHAETWFGGPVSHRMVGDRNWLAYSRPHDAVYQVWNGMDGLYVARADLDGPLGEKAALSFTNNYLVAREIVGLPGQTEYTRAMSAPPGGIAVDQRNGAVYVSWPDQEGVAVARSTDKGMTWTIQHIPGTRVTGWTGDTLWNLVPIAVDAKGNLYAAWSQAVGTDPENWERIALRAAVSRDGGATWRSVTVPTRTTAVFPTLALYGPDRVGVGWIDTSAAGVPPSAAFDDASWRLQYAELTGLLAGRPRIRQATVEPEVHTGRVCVGAYNSECDRTMGDFFSSAVAPDGSFVVAYTAGSGGSGRSRVAVLPRHAP